MRLVGDIENYSNNWPMYKINSQISQLIRRFMKIFLKKFRIVKLVFSKDHINR